MPLSAGPCARPPVMGRRSKAPPRMGMGLSGLPTRTSTVKRGLMVRLFGSGPAQARMGQNRRMKGVKIAVRRCKTCILDV